MPSPPPPPVAFANGYTGVVQSGAGASYQCSLSDGSTQTVTILQIDPGETIPAGTPLIVAKIGAAYYAQVPVWT